MFQLDPMQLAIGAIFEMCDFFSPNKRKKIVGICTKMFGFSFFYQQIRFISTNNNSFFYSISKLVTETEVVDIYQGILI